jgi:hypothetical protein
VEVDEFPDQDEIKYRNFEEHNLRKKYYQYLKTVRTEKQMQVFLEANPIFLPGLYDRHHGPLGDVIISKLGLSNDYVTDFAFLSVDSARIQITLIEIESPTMKIFRDSDNQFTAPFNKAIQQMRDWVEWFHANQTHAKDVLRDVYFGSVFRNQHVTIKVILVAGKRRDIERNSQREKRWAGLNASIGNNEVVSYDHLAFGMVANYYLIKNLICRPKRYVMQTLRHIKF